MVANWIVKHILKAVFRFFESFRARLVSRFANCLKQFVACKKNVTDYCKSVQVCPWVVLKHAGGKAGREGVCTV